MSVCYIIDYSVSVLKRATASSKTEFGLGWVGLGFRSKRVAIVNK